ncbi:MAG TPA: dienelactone hydrolase family protein [Myxococcaceae bacterium]|jgi:hypothetical protein
MRLRSEWLELNVGDAKAQGYFCSPAAAKETLPGVLVIQEAQAKLTIYSGAPHAFFNDTRGNYRPMASRDAWARTLTFFTAHLG